MRRVDHEQGHAVEPATALQFGWALKILLLLRKCRYVARKTRVRGKSYYMDDL